MVFAPGPNHSDAPQRGRLISWVSESLSVIGGVKSRQLPKRQPTTKPKSKVHKERREIAALRAFNRRLQEDDAENQRIIRELRASVSETAWYLRHAPITNTTRDIWKRAGELSVYEQIAKDPPIRCRYCNLHMVGPSLQHAPDCAWLRATDELHRNPTRRQAG